MLLTDVLLLPVRSARFAARALDDLNAVAERARRDPDPVEEIRERVDLLLVEIAALTVVAREIVVGGDDLHQTTKVLDAHAAQLVAATRRLTGALPRILEGLDTVEELEQAVETVAETVEPLQGAAERVGRVTDRLSRRG